MVTNEQNDTTPNKSEDQLYEDLAELIYDIYEDKLNEGLNDDDTAEQAQ